MAEYIKLTVRCQGCDKLIEKPSDADGLLFRNGLNCHNKEECFEKLEARLQATYETIQSWSAGHR